VERFNVFPAAKILTNPAKGYSTGQAIKAVEETAAGVLGENYSLHGQVPHIRKNLFLFFPR
jgi:multidrug efflux pump